MMDTNWGGYRDGAGRPKVEEAQKRKHRAVFANEWEWAMIKPIIKWLLAHPEEAQDLKNKISHAEE